MALYLLDLSAWVHGGHPDARGRWKALLNDDDLLCHPVFAVELLHNAISSADYRRLRADLDNGFDWRWPDHDTAEIAVRMQQQMATSAPTGQRVKTGDLLIAALAAQHDVGVLHYDSDYDIIRDRSKEPFESEWLAPRGSLDAAKEAAANPRKAYSKAFGERMVQLQDDSDLEVWPGLIEWMDAQLRARGLNLPPPPDLP